MAYLVALSVTGACNSNGALAADKPSGEMVTVDTPTQAQMDAELERVRAEVAAEQAVERGFRVLHEVLNERR